VEPYQALSNVTQPYQAFCTQQSDYCQQLHYRVAPEKYSPASELAVSAICELALSAFTWH
jgi:hypothetical protein